MRLEVVAPGMADPRSIAKDDASVARQFARAFLLKFGEYLINPRWVVWVKKISAYGWDAGGGYGVWYASEFPHFPKLDLFHVGGGFWLHLSKCAHLNPDLGEIRAADRLLTATKAIRAPLRRRVCELGWYPLPDGMLVNPEAAQVMQDGEVFYAAGVHHSLSAAPREVADRIQARRWMDVPGCSINLDGLHAIESRDPFCNLVLGNEMVRRVTLSELDGVLARVRQEMPQFQIT